MELHTLGVHGGYTQDDVTSLARIITGWTFAGRDGKLAARHVRLQRQCARARTAEAARQDLRGHRRCAGRSGTGRHRASSRDSRFIATKFVRHFIADDPPPALVAKLESCIQEDQWRPARDDAGAGGCG
jgi:uncharacterized protein (DUF1800 family)